MSKVSKLTHCVKIESPKVVKIDTFDIVNYNYELFR